MPETLRIGLDIGSTTIKCVVLNEADNLFLLRAPSLPHRAENARAAHAA